jgi:hypothetical protein
VPPGRPGTAGLEVGEAPEAQHGLLDEVVSRALAVGEWFTAEALGRLRQTDDLHSVAHVVLSPFLHLTSEE